MRAVSAANPRTVVVVNAGAPILLPWASEVPALLWHWLPGQEAGHALADVLLGRAEPSGRLPWTLPARAADVPVPDAVPLDGVVDYREGLHIGHRGYDHAGTEPAFPFGHGLGWTTWSYARVEAPEPSVPVPPSCPAGGDGPPVMVTLTNTGSRPGREVVQAYLETPAVPGDPLRVLAGFAVAEIAAGNTATITVAVPWRAFHHRDEAAGRWRPRTGRHRLRIGRSSRDPRLALALDVLPGARGAGHVLRFVP